MNAISVITVTHNSSAVLESFLQTVTTGMAIGDEIIVVDSGSSDLTETQAIADRFGAQLIVHSTNVGYGAGSNIGSRAASADWLAIVNPDVSVTMEELRTLSNQAALNGIQCIGPSIIDASGASVATIRNSISPPWRRTKHFVRRRGSLVFSESISGSCMVIAAEWFRRIDGFDEYFFMFCEEIDFHTRLRSQGGHVASTATVTICTPGGGSSSTASRRWAVTERSVAHVRYFRKHFTTAEACVDFIWRFTEILRGDEFSPRRESLKQFVFGVRQVRSTNEKVGR